MRRNKLLVIKYISLILILSLTLVGCGAKSNDQMVGQIETTIGVEGDSVISDDISTDVEDDKKPPKISSFSEDLEQRNQLVAEEESRAKTYEFLNIKENVDNTNKVDDVFEVGFDLNVDFENGDMFNPNIVDIGAYITTVSGETIKAIGFYKQKESPQWAFRYNPSEVGTYTYYLKNEKDQSVQTDPISFDIIEADKHRGRLQVAGNKIVDKNGEQFIPIGINLIDYPLYNNDSFDRSYSTIIPKLVNEGGSNLLRVWGEYHAGAFQLELAKGTYMECGIPQTFEGLGNYNLDNAQRMDELLEIMEVNDMYLNLALFNQWSFGTNFSKNAYNKEVGGMCVSQGGSTDFWSNEVAMKWQEQLIRYYSARYSASRAFAVFEFWNEVDSSAKAFSDSYTYKWLYRMDELWDSMNIHKVPTSNSYAWKDHASQGVSPWIKYDFIDIAQSHFYIDRGTDPVADWIDTLNNTLQVYEGPTFIGEFSENGAEHFSDELMKELDGMSDYYMLEGFWSPVFFGNGAGSNLFWKINQNFVPNDRCLQFMKVFSDMAKEYGKLFATANFSYHGINDNGIQLGGFTSTEGAILYGRDTTANDKGETIIVSEKEIESVSYVTKDPREVSLLVKSISGLENGSYQVNYLNIEDGSVINESEAIVTDGSLTLEFPSFKRGIFVSAIKK